MITADYFGAMGITTVRGRAFTEARDSLTAPREANSSAEIFPSIAISRATPI